MIDIHKVCLIQYLFQKFNDVNFTEDFLNNEQDRYLMMAISGIVINTNYIFRCHRSDRNEIVYLVEINLNT